MKIDHIKLRNLFKDDEGKPVITTEELYKKIGGENSSIKLETLKAYRKGNVKTPSFDVLFAIAKGLNCDVFDIIENGDYYKDKLKINSRMPETLAKIYLKNSYVGAGSFGLLGEDEMIKETYIDINLILKKYRKCKINGIQVIGDSMFPYVNNGDVVFYVDIPRNYPVIDGKYIINKNGDLQLKNITFKINGDIIISSENNKYSNDIIEKDSQVLDNFSVIGIVVGRFLKS